MHVDGATEGLDVTFHEREAKTRALDAGPVGLGRAIELAEDARLLVRGNTGAVIGDAERCREVIRRNRDFDRLVRGTVLRGVRDSSSLRDACEPRGITGTAHLERRHFHGGTAATSCQSPACTFLAAVSACA